MESIENTVNVDLRGTMLDDMLEWSRASSPQPETPEFQPGQDMTIFDEWINEPSHDTPPTELPPVSSHDTSSPDTSEKTCQTAEPEMLYWFNEDTMDDIASPSKKMKLEEGDSRSSTPTAEQPWGTIPGEDIPPKFGRPALKQKVIRRWNLDRTTKIIANPDGLRFLNATDFTLSTEEWRTWCEEWRSDARELVLSEDRDEKCTLLSSEYGMELKRKRGLRTTKFHLSNYQCKTLERRASYVSDHLDLLRENAGPIRIMKSVVATKLMEMAAKMNLGMTYPALLNETFDTVLENAVSLGITSDALRSFNSEMKIRGLYCGLDHYSVFFYCMFQLSDLRELLM